MEVRKFVKDKFKDITDKAGQLYFYHCSRVAKKAFRSCSNDIIALKVWYVGMLHDILEDTNTTIEELKQIDGITDEIIESVKAITRGYYGEETYFEYIERVSKNELAKIVKIADLIDNMDITRFDKLTDEHFSLLKRYHKAYKMIVK